jgi:hypothetical protein
MVAPGNYVQILVGPVVKDQRTGAGFRSACHQSGLTGCNQRLIFSFCFS